MAQELLHDLASLDPARIVIPKEEIRRLNPHRYEFELLDAVIHFDPGNGLAVGYHDLREDAFWVRGHIPGLPLFPGALMLEAAGQLASLCFRHQFPDNTGRFFGFGGIDKVKFREMASPGQRLFVLCRKLILNRRLSRFAVQGAIEGRSAFEGEITGVSIGLPRAQDRETAADQRA
jgi:3-hydroxyacyl-[acyl-carrier-protein] dehydratase